MARLWWECRSLAFSAKERRVLITHWVCNAYNKLISQDYKPYVWRMWEKTGSLITADGSEDEKIQPEDFKEYNVQTPMPMEPGQVLPVSITAQKTNFSIRDFFCKCNQIRRKLRIWSSLLKISLMANIIFLSTETLLMQWMRKTKQMW